MRRLLFLLALTLVLGIAVGLIGQQTANAQPVRDPRVADLVQAGKLRAGLGVVAPHWAIKDPATGELRGVAVDLARALAARLGVELVPVEYPSPTRACTQSLKVGTFRFFSGGTGSDAQNTAQR